MNKLIVGVYAALVTLNLTAKSRALTSDHRNEFRQVKTSRELEKKYKVTHADIFTKHRGGGGGCAGTECKTNKGGQPAQSWAWPPERID